MSTPSLLAIAGDTPWLADMIDWLRRRGVIVHAASTAREALELHRSHDAEMILVGLPLADTAGTEILSALLDADPHAAIVVVGTDAEITTSQQALAHGATTHVADPHDRADIVFALGRALGTRTGDASSRLARSNEASRSGWSAIVSESQPMLQVIDKVKKICERTLSGAAPTVLLCGEIGTGKSLLARSLHYNSARRFRPFVEVSCRAPELGTVLFGRPGRPGAFELANGGTLFLQEVAAVPEPLHGALLRAIDERVVSRDGAPPSRLDVQVIASTRRDLKAMWRAGELREDLYHRLSVLSVELPPLRERGTDVLALATHLLGEIAAEHGVPAPTLSLEAQLALARHSWPGNLRELRSELERIVLLVDADVIDERHVQLRSLRSEIGIANEATRLEVSIKGESAPLDDIERELIRSALEKSNGNVSRAARFLCITRQTLLYRMKKHGFAGTTNPDL
jgi:two-component system NtrC family response regulator